MVKSIKILLYIACWTISCDIWTQCELFTAVTALEPLIDSQKAFIDVLEEYFERKDKGLQFMTKFVENLKVEEEKIQDSKLEDYFGDPINYFRLIKRLSTDLILIEKGIMEGIRPLPNIKLPSQEDMDGVTMALQRIQVVYKINIQDIVEGFLNGLYSTPLTTSDCYEMAESLFKMKTFKLAIVWTLLAYEKYKRTDRGMYRFAKEDIVELIFYIYKELEDYKNALEWLNRLLAMKPGDPRYAIHFRSQKYLEDRVNKEELIEMRKKTLRNLPPKKPPMKDEEDPEIADYITQCRGEWGLSKKVIKMLKCRYLRTHPFLRLAPVKMEQLYIKPDIVMFYEVLSDHDIEQIINISKPMLQTGKTADDRLVKGPSIFRTGKVAWIPDNASDAIARLSRRVTEITGFTTDTAEDLQVFNYGIGGHYMKHYDFCQLSEVAQGGATVFTELGLTVHPVKGAAVFWVNLHRSGEGDLATLHGACPVIHGSKWIANKWIQEAGQELIRPCTLEYQEEGILHKIQRPVRKKKYKTSDKSLK